MDARKPKRRSSVSMRPVWTGTSVVRQARAVFGGLMLGCMALGPVLAQDDTAMVGFDDDEAAMAVDDPIEPFNRAVYHVNDKLYFWVLKPVATGYKAVVPEVARTGIGNAFDNLGMPRRSVNCLLQGRFTDSFTEASRFVINSSIGLLGVWDPAEVWWEIAQVDEDFGQTLGVHGVGSGIYLTLPVFGPSNCRDAVGLVADAFLDPINYVISDAVPRLAVKAEDKVNSTSFRLGDYEKSKETALDHYVSLRESYTQYRDEQIRR